MPPTTYTTTRQLKSALKKGAVLQTQTGRTLFKANGQLCYHGTFGTFPLEAKLFLDQPLTQVAVIKA